LRLRESQSGRARTWESGRAPEGRGGIGEFGTAGAKLPGTPANAQSSATCRPAFDASMLRAKLET